MKITSIKIQPHSSFATVNVRYMSSIVSLVVDTKSPESFSIRVMPREYSRKKFQRVLGNQLQGKKFRSRLVRTVYAAHEYGTAYDLVGK